LVVYWQCKSPLKGLGQVFKAVTSAMIGVGKREDLIKDFERTEKQGPWTYIVVGLIMTIGFGQSNHNW
jgi:hypothetical protein